MIRLYIIINISKYPVDKVTITVYMAKKPFEFINININIAITIIFDFWHSNVFLMLFHKFVKFHQYLQSESIIMTMTIVTVDTMIFRYCSDSM